MNHHLLYQVGVTFLGAYSILVTAAIGWLLNSYWDERQADKREAAQRRCFPK